MTASVQRNRAVPLGVPRETPQPVAIVAQTAMHDNDEFAFALLHEGKPSAVQGHRLR